ncbi:MAG: S8 family serine peptidase [Bdellovibrionales bacterium]
MDGRHFRLLYSTFAVACLLVSLVSQGAWAQDYVPGEVIVKLKNQAGAQAQFMGKAKPGGTHDMNLRKSFPTLKMYHYKLGKGQNVDVAVQQLKNDPDVEYAEPNYYISKQSTGMQGKALSFGEVQALAGSNGKLDSSPVDIGLQEARSSLTASSVKPIIAVIDTGVDIDHPVFTESNAIWTNSGEIPGNSIDDDGNGYVDDVNGWNFVTNSGTMFDDDDHGTHVAGTILSVAVDIFASPVAEAPFKIMPLKFLDGNGVGTTTDAIAAIEYALANGATILNNSWGGPSYSHALHEAVADTYTAGSSFIAAAGNLGTNNDSAPMYPASYDVPNVVSIAATTSSDNLASFSNFGYNTVHIGSPGVYILSTIDGGSFGYMSGTSMATPYVSGIAGLMKTQATTMLGFQMKQLIESSADQVSPLSGKVSTEARVNAIAAVAAAQSVSIDGSQPGYDVNGGSRSPAWNDKGSGGGCGLVSMLAYDRYKNGPGGGPPKNKMSNSIYKNGKQYRVEDLKQNSLLFKIVAFLVLGLPMVMAMFMKKNVNPQERRRHERFQISSKVSMKVGDKELVGNVSSISLGGLKVDTDAMLEQGGIIRMSIESPDGAEKVEVAGKVVWSQERESYGVQFEEANNSVLSTITGWTTALKKI